MKINPVVEYVHFCDRRGDLTAKTVQSSALSLECVDDVHGGDRLALGMLGVGNRVADHVFKENF